MQLFSQSGGNGGNGDSDGFGFFGFEFLYCFYYVYCDGEVCREKYIKDYVLIIWKLFGIWV